MSKRGTIWVNTYLKLRKNIKRQCGLGPFRHAADQFDGIGEGIGVGNMEGKASIPRLRHVE